MTRLLLGIDTGGTYTDAVIIDQSLGGVDGGSGDGLDALVAAAKSETTRHDLSIGISGALDAVLEQAGNPDPASIGLCALSTTLATNAIVEGLGGRVGLIAVGFEPADLERGGLGDAIEGDHVISIGGGHTAAGVERQPLDIDSLTDALSALPADLVGFAVVSQFAVRNAAHELAVREALAATGLAVTCSHELTAKLNGPKRALTCVLNARLVGLIDDLLNATDTLLTERSIDAPRMVVRGDGSLVSLDFARSRPIETILSGPAASLVGATYLAGAGSTPVTNAIVSDIGGTTTDVAVILDGRPAIDRNGAMVGGHQTMVEAVAMRTTGLGGDSEVSIDDSGRHSRLRLGPRRVVPISMLADEHPEIVLAAFDRQLSRFASRELDGTFGRLRNIVPTGVADELGPIANEVIAGLVDGPVALVELLPTRRHEMALDELIARGLVQKCAVTPTDAAVALGMHRGVTGNSMFDPEAAARALTLVARRKDRHGAELAAGPIELAQDIVDALVESSAMAVLASVLPDDGFAAETAHHPITQAGLARHRGLVNVDVALGVPLVAVGASASVYYPPVAARLNTEALVPRWSDVANAVGAVVGNIRMSEQAQVTPLKKGLFRAHLDMTDHDSAEAAIAHTERHLSALVEERAKGQGAATVVVVTESDDVWATVDGLELFVESTVTAVASARPEFV